MMHGRTRLIYTLLLAASFFIEGTQAAFEVQAYADYVDASSPSSALSSFPSTPPTATFFLFEDLPQPTTCDPTTILWSYNGPDGLFTIGVTNVNVSQNEVTPTTSLTSTSTSNNFPTNTIRDIEGGSSTPLNPPNITEIIATDITLDSPLFIWDPVNVPQGWYIFTATIPAAQLTRSSPMFFVRTGTNTSCLTVNNSTTSTTSSSSPNTATSMPSQPITSTPPSDLSPSPSVDVRTIVGATVGMTALVICAVALWLFFYRRAKSHTSRGGSSNNFIHRWNGLSSTDSRGTFGAKATSKNYRSSRSHIHSHADSAATTMGPDFEDDGLGAEKTTNFTGKASDFFEEQGVALSTLPVLHSRSQRSRPNRTYSTSSSAFNMNDHGEVLPVERSSVQFPAHRRTSIDSSSPSFPISPQAPRDSLAQDLVVPDISHSLSTIGTQHSSSPSQQTSSYQSSIISPQSSLQTPAPPFYPNATASEESKQMYRQSLGRKRKPVPAYDLGKEPPSPASPTLAPPSLPFAANKNSAAVPELTHKSSFGPGGIEGKPLHYLIPDMPMAVDR